MRKLIVLRMLCIQEQIICIVICMIFTGGEAWKKDIVSFVLKCPTFQPVEVEHQRLDGLLQNIEVPERKWERIAMDCFTGLLHTRIDYDSV